MTDAPMSRDGGPAFPPPATNGSGWDVDAVDEEMPVGMTLRDWFAGRALAGIMACGTMMHREEHAPSNARHAYAVADAMLAERERKETE